MQSVWPKIVAEIMAIIKGLSDQLVVYMKLRPCNIIQQTHTDNSYYSAIPCNLYRSACATKKGRERYVFDLVE